MIDLHCHLDGSITLEIAKRLAEIQNITLSEETDEELLKTLSVPDNCESLNDFLQCFALPLRLLQTKKGITEAIRLVCQNCKNQGLKYLEIRFAPQLHQRQGLTQEEAVLAALDGLKQTELHANLILCLMRDNGNDKENFQTIELAKKYIVKDNGVVAIDLAGAEALFKTKDFKKFFDYATECNIPFTIHAGEADGAESVWSAINFGAKRIGHGVRAFEDEKLLTYIVKNEISLEMCPTSNRQTNALADMKNYPLKEFLARGIKVTLNTDDMAICRTTLANEFSYIEKVFGLSPEEKKQLLLNSIEAAFCSDEYKATLKKALENYLDI